MKKITLLLFTMLAFTLQGFAQITVSDSPALAIPDNDPVGTSTTIIVGDDIARPWVSTSYGIIPCIRPYTAATIIQHSSTSDI